MGILVGLHEEGRTLVMVTHDVGLKSFTNRVVRVLDGKVIRIEDIPSEERELAKLRIGNGTSPIRAGTNQLLTPDMPRFQQRSPSDYPCVAFRKDRP